MKRGILGLAGLCAGIALMFACGNKSTNPPVEAATTVPIASLRLDNTAVPGWADSSYVTGDTSKIWAQIDGGGMQDIQHGMRYFSRQKMQKLMEALSSYFCLLPY